MMRPMDELPFSEIPSLNSTRSNRASMTWDAFVDRFSCFHEISNKSDKFKVPLWSPCVFEGHGRKKAFAISIQFFVLDFDSATVEQIESAVDIIESKWNCYFHVHSTASHSRKAPKVRIIIPLKNEVKVSNWGYVWRSLVKHFPGCDLQCSDVNRAYLEPTQSGKVTPICFSGGSKLLDLADVAPESLSKELSSSAGVSLTLGMIKRLGAAQRQSSDPSKALQGERFYKLGSGFKLAEEGERDSELFAICNSLVNKWPTLLTSQVAELFEKSISHWGGDFTVEDVELKLERAVEHYVELAEERKNVALESRNKACVQFWRGTPETDRASCYNEEDFPQILAVAGVSQSDPDPISTLKNRWVLQKSNSYWVLTKYGYRRASKDDVAALCRDLLAPANSMGIEVWQVTDAGLQLFPAGQLVSQYGTVVSHVAASCSAEYSHYDESTNAIVEVNVTITKFEPIFHEEIDYWIDVLAGPNSGAVKRWLYWLKDLQSPCAALFLSGPGGTGKSLLVRGISKIWGSGTGTPYRVAAQDANYPVTRCPLVVAEESLRTRNQKSADMDFLRDFIQAREHTVRQLYYPPIEMRGAIRLLIAAQKPEILHSEDQAMNIDDVEAISERICLVQVSSEAKKYLAKIIAEYGSEELELWADQKIGEYITWLWENKSYKPQGRFLVKVDSTSAQRTAAAMSPKAAELLDAIARDLADGGGLTRGALLNGQQCVVVNLRKVIDNWESWHKTPRPKSQALANAIKPLCISRLREEYVLDVQPVKNLALDVGYKIDFEKVCTQNITVDKQTPVR